MAEKFVEDLKSKSIGYTYYNIEEMDGAGL